MKSTRSTRHYQRKRFPSLSLQLRVGQYVESIWWYSVLPAATKRRAQPRFYSIAEYGGYLSDGGPGVVFDNRSIRLTQRTSVKLNNYLACRYIQLYLLIFYQSQSSHFASRESKGGILHLRARCLLYLTQCISMYIIWYCRYTVYVARILSTHLSNMREGQAHTLKAIQNLYVPLPVSEHDYSWKGVLSRLEDCNSKPLFGKESAYRTMS